MAGGDRGASRSLRACAPVELAVAVLVVSLGGAVALELASTGVRPAGLGPPVVAVCLGAFGSAITWRRPDVRLGPLLVVNGLGFAVGTLAAAALDYGSVHPIPRLAAQSCFAAVSSTRVLIAAWVLFILWFPDGRFTSPRWRRFFLAATTLCAALTVGAWLVGPSDRVFDFFQGTAVPPGAGGPLADTWPPAGRLSNLLLLLPLVSLLSLAHRYRGGGPVLRRQVRWLLLALTVEVGAQVVGAALTAAGGHDGGYLLGVLTQPLPTLAATLAILRYRLWDIDLVISRALVHGVLWAALSGLLLLPALAAGLLVAGPSALTAVAIALVVTVVFHPARRRLEALAEQLVYRNRIRPYAVLSELWEALREAGLERLGALLAEAVNRALDVEWAGVWLYVDTSRGGTLRPLGATSGCTPAEVVVSAAAARRLHGTHVLGPDRPELAALGGTPAAAAVPLVAGDELVGLLACGGRRGDRLGTRDFELLELLARECALRLRNLRLEAQLRERLAQIEAQAAQLRQSRQRLVAAQDEERRRIERDLHDGVQQQLVSLAARLQRLSAAGAPALSALAAEAEQAVFALQELGRGIYPSVLADQGLPAALRTQAARMPAAVHLDVDEVLLTRRLDRDVEATLYFVALEALANALKHAPGAGVTVRLSTSPGAARLVVADDGPGLAAAGEAGSGLQNMRDRVAAVGGTLTVESRSGEGTRIEASVPTAFVPAPHPAEPAGARPVEAEPAGA